MDARQTTNTIRGLSSDVRTFMKNAEVQRGFGIFAINGLIADVIYFLLPKTSFYEGHDSLACSQIKGKFVARCLFLTGLFPATVGKLRFV